MKTLLLFAMCFFNAAFLYSQQTPEKPMAQQEKISIKVEEGNEKMSQGYNHCLKVFIAGAQKTTVEKDFARYMKEFDAKADETRGEYFFDNASINQFGNNPVDVYSIAIQQDQGVMLEVFFDLGGSYLDSKDHGEKFKIAERMLHDFARREVGIAIQSQVDRAQKVMQTRLREHDELVRQDSMYHKKIRDSRQVIKESEENIIIVREKQAAKLEEIKEQQKMIDALKAKDAGIE